MEPVVPSRQTPMTTFVNVTWVSPEGFVKKILMSVKTRPAEMEDLARTPTAAMSATASLDLKAVTV